MVKLRGGPGALGVSIVAQRAAFAPPWCSVPVRSPDNHPEHSFELALDPSSKSFIMIDELQLGLILSLIRHFWIFLWF